MLGSSWGHGASHRAKLPGGAYELTDVKFCILRATRSSGPFVKFRLCGHEVLAVACQKQRCLEPPYQVPRGVVIHQI